MFNHFSSRLPARADDTSDFGQWLYNCHAIWWAINQPYLKRNFNVIKSPYLLFRHVTKGESLQIL